jgi:hypothetical protein
VALGFQPATPACGRIFLVFYNSCLNTVRPASETRKA